MVNPDFEKVSLPDDGFYKIHGDKKDTKKYILLRMPKHITASSLNGLKIKYRSDVSKNTLAEFAQEGFVDQVQPDGEIVSKVQRELYKLEKCDNGLAAPLCLVKPSKDKLKLDSSCFSEVWNVSLSVKVPEDLQVQQDESQLELSIRPRVPKPQPSLAVSRLSPFELPVSKKVKQK